MPEELRLLPRSSRTPSATRRDWLAVIYRRQRLALACFAVFLLAVVLYRLLAPAYQAEMSVLVRHSPIVPVVSWAPAAPRSEAGEVTDKELNSEVELLHDQEILDTVVKAARLDLSASFLSRLWGESDEERRARAVRRLDSRLSVAAVQKTTLIRVTYRSSDPSQAATVLRCLAGAYLARHARFDRPPGESNFLEQQVVESRRLLEQAQGQLVEFFRDRGAAAASGREDHALPLSRAAHPLGDRAGQQDELLKALSAAEDQYFLARSQREAAKIGEGVDQERTLNVMLAEQPTAPALPAQSALSFGCLGLVFAGTFSTAITLLADRLRPAFHTPDEVVAYLGIPVLASLPRRGARRRAPSGPGASPAREPHPSKPPLAEAQAFTPRGTHEHTDRSAATSA
jgi:capsular polysaccharide biosynthesis protein